MLLFHFPVTTAEETNMDLSAADKEIRDDRELAVRGDQDRNTGSNKQRRKRNRRKRKNQVCDGVESPDNHVSKGAQKRQAADQNSEQEFRDKSKKLEDAKPKAGQNDKGEKMVMDNQVDKRSRSGGDEKTSGSGRTNSQCKDSRNVGDSERSMIKNDVEYNQVIRKTSHTEDVEQRVDAVRQKAREVHDHEVQTGHNKEDKKVKKHEGSFQSTKEHSNKETNVHPRPVVKTKEKSDGQRERADELSHRGGSSERPCSEGPQGSRKRLEKEIRHENAGEERQTRRSTGDTMKPVDQKHPVEASGYSGRKGQIHHVDNPLRTRAEITKATNDEGKGDCGANNQESLSLNDSPSPKSQSNRAERPTDEIERESEAEQKAELSDSLETRKQKKKNKKIGNRIKSNFKMLFCSCSGGKKPEERDRKR